MVVEVPLEVMLALPEVVTPPVGAAKAIEEKRIAVQKKPISHAKQNLLMGFILFSFRLLLRI